MPPKNLLKVVRYAYLDADDDGRLASHSERTGVPKAEIIRRALREWLDRHEKAFEAAAKALKRLGGADKAHYPAAA